jgi:hypothetical protein
VQPPSLLCMAPTRPEVKSLATSQRGWTYGKQRDGRTECRTIRQSFIQERTSGLSWERGFKPRTIA